MPSIFSHPAVPIAMACLARRERVSLPILAVGVVASVLPDADTVGFKFGIRYGDLCGHRGLSHSFFFALLFAVAATWLIGGRWGSRPWFTFGLLFLSMASHGLLDGFTNGGLGVAFFSPFDTHRYFLPWQPIEVSPIGVHSVFSARFLRVVLSEVTWIWLPTLLLACTGFFLHRAHEN